MAKHVEQQNIIEMQCAGAAKQAEEKRKRIVRLFLIILMRSIYFLAMNRIPQPNTYKELIELQVLNGNELLEKLLSEGPSNAQYSSRLSAMVFIEAIDIWVERKIMCSLQESHTLHQGVHTMHYSAELSISPKVYLVWLGGRKHNMLDTAYHYLGEGKQQEWYLEGVAAMFTSVPTWRML